VSYRLIKTLRGYYGYLIGTSGYIYKDFQLYRFYNTGPLYIDRVLPSLDYRTIFDKIAERKKTESDYIIVDDMNNVSYLTKEIQDCYEGV